MIRTMIHELVEQQAAARPAAPALSCKSVSVTYAELREQMDAVAAGLQALGVPRGERVAIYLDKRVETVAAIFGTSRAAGVFVPINPLLRPQQVGYILADCSVRVLVTSQDRLDSLRTVLAGCPALTDIVVVDGDGDGDDGDGDGGDASTPPQPRSATVTTWSAFVDPGRSAAAVRGVDADIAAILYTSGSTGSPKGVVLSHRNLIVGAESVSTYLDNRPDDVILSALPLSFDAGFSQITTAFSVGAHVVLMNYTLPADLVRLCAKHRVTGLTCVPPLWLQIAERTWPEEATSSLRYFANTGGRMPRATLDRLREIFPTARPYLMYGLTEAFRSTYLDPAEVDRRPDSIGRAIPNAEILVMRPDGTPCAAGEQGELVHRGPLVALGYWNDPERTAARFRPMPGTEHSWRSPEIAVWSGDTVVADDEGFLYFVGRSDEMIKTSGYRVSPTELEEAAYSTGLVGDAVALGIEDDRLGQRIVMLVSPAAGRTLEPDELIAALKKTLPLYMVPHRVDVRDSLPRSPNGKFDRNLLRTQL